MCSQSNAEIVFKDKFNEKKEWNFITDQVMGGISTGTFNYKKIRDKPGSKQYKKDPAK